MFDKYSFINSVGEYAYDCDNRCDMLLRQVLCKHAILITTNYGEIIVTHNTRICTAQNIWKRAKDLVANESLKHYIMGVTTIKRITLLNKQQYMLKIIDCQCNYLIIEGIYISADM